MAILIFSIYCPLKTFIAGSCNIIYLSLIKSIKTIRKSRKYCKHPYYTDNYSFAHTDTIKKLDKDTH